MIKIANILTGWINLLLDPEPLREIVEKRAIICSECSKLKILGLVCSLCDCPVAAKVRAPGESCPLGLWKETTATEIPRDSIPETLEDLPIEREPRAPDQ